MKMMLPELNNIIIDFYLDNYTWKSLIKRISKCNYEYDRKNIINELCLLKNMKVSKFYQEKFNKWINCWVLNKGNLFNFNKVNMIKYIYHLSDYYTIYWPVEDNWNCDITSTVDITINDKININVSFDKPNELNLSVCKMVDDDVTWEGYDYVYEVSHILYLLNIPCKKGNNRFKANINPIPFLI
jgi:hypothetical protein